MLLTSTNLCLFAGQLVTFDLNKSLGSLFKHLMELVVFVLMSAPLFKIFNVVTTLILPIPMPYRRQK